MTTTEIIVRLTIGVVAFVSGWMVGRLLIKFLRKRREKKAKETKKQRNEDC